MKGGCKMNNIREEKRTRKIAGKMKQNKEAVPPAIPNKMVYFAWQIHIVTEWREFIKTVSKRDDREGSLINLDVKV